MSKKRAVLSFVYEKFYDVLTDQFYSRFSDGQRLVDKKSRLIWNFVHEDDESEISSTLFGTKSKEYFYRKLLEARGNGVASVERSSLYKALSFIGVKPDDQLVGFNALSELDQEEVLYARFLKDYNIDEKGISTRPQKLTKSDRLNIEIFGTELDRVSELVKRFYGHLEGEENLKIAWKLVSDSMKGDRWKSKYSIFVSGYQNTKGIQNCAVFNVSQTSPSAAQCVVYYEDYIDAYYSDSISGLVDITVGEIDKFISLLDGIKHDVARNGVTDFGTIPLRKLFDPVSSEYIIYNCDFKRKAQYEFFDRQEGTIVKRLKLVKCIKSNDEWLINEIDDLPSHSIR